MKDRVYKNKDFKVEFKNGFWSTPNILFKAAMAY